MSRYDLLIEHVARREEAITRELGRIRDARTACGRLIASYGEARDAAGRGLAPQEHPLYLAYCTRLAGMEAKARGDLAELERHEDDARARLLQVHQRRRSFEHLAAAEARRARTRAERRMQREADEIAARRWLEVR